MYPEQQRELRVCIKAIVSPRSPPSTWFSWFSSAERYFDGPCPTCRPAEALRQHTLRVRTFTRPAAAHQRKQALKGPKANTEAAETLTNPHFLPRTIQTTPTFGRCAVTSSRFSVSRAVDWPHAKSLYSDALRQHYPRIHP